MLSLNPMQQALKTLFLNCPRRGKQLLLIAVDVVLLLLAVWLSFSLRFGELYLPTPAMCWIALAAPLIAVPIFIKSGLYRAIIRYTGFRALVTVARAVGLYALIWALLLMYSRLDGTPRSVGIINALLAFLLISGSRVLGRWWLMGQALSNSALEREGRVRHRTPVAIYGAGSAGVQLALALAQSPEMKVEGFLDDDPKLARRLLNGVEIFPPDRLGVLIENSDVAEVLLALPSISRQRRNEILGQLEAFPVRVRTLPGIGDLAQGRVKVQDLRELDVVDLLGRDPVAPDPALMAANNRGKSVMVTGAGGSIGSELCRQVIGQGPRRLVLFDVSEYALYRIDLELREAAARDGLETEILPLLGSVNHRRRVESVMRSFAVETIYHAAAYKHVPLVEFNPIEGIRNNVFGTLRTAEAAIAAGVQTFVLISTDKAVRPTNIMGATKRLAELVLQALAAENQDIAFSMVRFGNVLGSSGSVVPLFREQLKRGGPITLTHLEITRYFMTIPEASQLVIQAGAMARGGDVFVLDMGAPIKIVDLARRMIHLSGLEVRNEATGTGDIAIEVTGLRPGEKLYEELLIGENVHRTEHPLIMRAEDASIPWHELTATLAEIDRACGAFDMQALRSLLLRTVTGYQPQCGIEDLAWVATG